MTNNKSFKPLGYGYRRNNGGRTVVLCVGVLTKVAVYREKVFKNRYLSCEFSGAPSTHEESIRRAQELSLQNGLIFLEELPLRTGVFDDVSAGKAYGEKLTTILTAHRVLVPSLGNQEFPANFRSPLNQT